jgi:hypothetical protein
MSLLTAIVLSRSPSRAGAAGTAGIVTDDDAYNVGETITATVTGGPAGATNAVGLYLPAGNPATDDPVDWKYLASNNQTLPGAGVASGAVTFSGLGQGSYVAHLLDEPLLDEPEITTPWVYPLLGDYTDDKQIIANGSVGSWNRVHWNCCGQSFVEIGNELIFVLEAGESWGTEEETAWDAGSAMDVFELEHANRARLGFWGTTDLFGSWSAKPNGARIVFDPTSTTNEIEQGTWHHAVALNPGGGYRMIFGGQRGAGATSVDIAIYYATSTDFNDWGGGATNPYTITDPAGSARIINDVSTFAGCDGAAGELAPGGLDWDADAGQWDITYIAKMLAEPEHWALYHAWGGSLTGLTAANSALLMNTHKNPMNAVRPTSSSDATAGANGQWYPGIIVNRGFGYKDVLAMGFDNQDGEFFTDCALIRIPITEPGTPYSWSNPGPTEILYRARDSLMSIPAGMQMMATLGVSLAQQRVALAYQQYRYGALQGDQQKQRLRHAPLVRSADGRPPYTPAAARFNGTSQFLSRASRMTGQASSSDVTFCVNVKMISLPLAGGEMYLWRFEEGTSYRFVVVINDAGIVRILGRTDAGTTILDLSATIPLVVGTWTSIVGSLTMASYGNSWLRIGGADAKPASAAVFTSGSLGFTDGVSMRFGAQDATQKFLNAEVADCGICIGWHVPLDGGAALNRYLAAPPNVLQHPRGDGRGLFPAIPHAFFSGSGPAFQTNLGKGGVWSINGGDLAVAASTPPGHA